MEDTGVRFARALLRDGSIVDPRAAARRKRHLSITLAAALLRHLVAQRDPQGRPHPRWGYTFEPDTGRRRARDVALSLLGGPRSQLPGCGRSKALRDGTRCAGSGEKRVGRTKEIGTHL